MYRLIVSKLRKYEQEIESYYENFIANGEDEDLHQLRVYIRKSRVLLKSFEPSFKSKKSVQRMIKKLGIIAKKSNRTRDLDVFMEACYQRFSLFIARLPIDFYENLVQQRHQERIALDRFLKSETVTYIFFEYHNLLEKLAEKEPKEKPETFEAILARHLNHIEGLYQSYCANHEELLLHKMRIAFKKVRYLLEAFKDKKEITAYHKMIKRSKLLQQHLGHFHDLAVQQMFIERYLLEHSLEPQDRVEFDRFLVAIHQEKDQVKQEIRPLLMELLA